MCPHISQKDNSYLDYSAHVVKLNVLINTIIETILAKSFLYQKRRRGFINKMQSEVLYIRLRHKFAIWTQLKFIDRQFYLFSHLKDWDIQIGKANPKG